MIVTIFVTGDDGQAKAEGTIEWRGHALICNPADDQMLRKVLEVPVPGPNGEEIDALTNPGAWLSNLYRGLSGGYMRASKPTVSNPARDAAA